MTARPDAELEVLFCERVLGWHRGAYGDWFDSADRFVRSAIYPLHSLDDAFAGLRAHPEWEVCIETTEAPDGSRAWLVTITSDYVPGGHDANRWDHEHTSSDLCRAIVLASLRACGVEV
jgi:hypothetical protein